MTDDIKLLPLPEKKRLAVRYERSFGSVTAYGHSDDTLRDYARANVAAATAALQAENERLREEVAEWKRVAAAQAELHGEAEDRADKLAEALREVMLWIENWSPPFTEDDEWPDTEAKAQAALHPTAAQENNDA